MIVRELTDDEQAREADEALADIAATIAPEEGHIVDFDRGAVVQPEDDEGD